MNPVVPGAGAFAQLRARISAEARDRFRRGEAVVGGKWWEIDPARNYCDASGVLVQECQKRGTFGPLALPTISLQRHAVELSLKALSRVAHDALDTLGQPIQRPDFDQNHRLEDWLKRLEVALQPIGLPLPSSAPAVVGALVAVGDWDGQNWRYGRQRPGRGQPVEPAFPTEQLLPIREIQQKVETFFEESYGDVPGGDGLFWDLGAIAQDPATLATWLRTP